MTLPLVNERVFSSFSGKRCLSVSNGVLPFPSVMGLTTICSSSISRASASCVTNRAAAQNADALARLLLELVHLAGQIVFEQLRVLPRRFFERTRDDDFGCAVHAVRYGRILLLRHRRRPIANHQLVGHAAE